MPHIAPVILKRRPGFLGTPKRPPPWALGTGIGRAQPLRSGDSSSDAEDAADGAVTTDSIDSESQNTQERVEDWVQWKKGRAQEEQQAGHSGRAYERQGASGARSAICRQQLLSVGAGHPPTPLPLPCGAARAAIPGGPRRGVAPCQGGPATGWSAWQTGNHIKVATFHSNQISAEMVGFRLTKTPHCQGCSKLYSTLGVQLRCGLAWEVHQHLFAAAQVVRGAGSALTLRLRGRAGRPSGARAAAVQPVGRRLCQLAAPTQSHRRRQPRRGTRRRRIRCDRRRGGTEK
eukprot:COSAG06_NODE_234_length_19567_cov_23.768595_2_plen_289_part_00